jgi:predicted nuclease of predicted toxin-antitoxin system
MKLLLDENLPKRLKNDFPTHEIYAIRDKKWNGKKNGELIKLMLEENFDALLTFDKNIQYQQNFEKYPICILVLSAKNNSYLELSKLSKKINSILLKESLNQGSIIIKPE